MVTRIQSLILSLLLITVAPLSYALTSLTAQLDRNPAMAGETVILTLTADDSVSSDKLDTSALLKQFIVGQTNIGRSTQVVNGKVNRISTWNIALIARTPGQYTIAPFTIDGISSAPLTLDVVKATSTRQTNSDIMLKTKISGDNAFVGQQLIYTVNLYIGSSLQRAHLQPPELANAEISQIGEDVESNEISNGRRYRVITRQYAIRPTTAGNVELQGSIFRGDIQIGQRGFFNGGRSKPITLLSDNHQLSINAIPDNFPGQWLVSDLVVLEQAWSTPKVFQVGEPITQTLTLTATNITQEQLPELDIDFGKNFQVYPDKAITSQALNGDVMIAQSVQKIAIIPSRAGKMLLPAIRVPWFNARSQKIEWATVEAQQIDVQAAPGKQSQSTMPVAEPTPAVADKPTPQPQRTQILLDSPQLIYWQLACLFLAIICAALLVSRWRSRRTPALVTGSDSAKTNQDLHWTTLQRALIDNNHREVIRVMPLWLANKFAISIEQLATIEPALYDAYQQVIADSYGKITTATNCDELLKLSRQLRADNHQKNDDDEGLYPTN